MLKETICNHLSERIEKGELSNNDLVRIIEHCGSYLNLRTRSAYSKENNLSYNGAKYYRQNINLFGVKFIIDND